MSLTSKKEVHDQDGDDSDLGHEPSKTELALGEATTSTFAHKATVRG